MIEQYIQVEKKNIQFPNQSGEINCKSPSNIALVKYWGKYGMQLPQNPSISLTLHKAYTQMTWAYKPIINKTKNIHFSFLFEGNRMPTFEKKIHTYIHSLIKFFPFLTHYHINIESSNSFPHSSGIASSASAMSALAFCICTMEKKLYGESIINKAEFLKKVSYMARLGSGSACRSVYDYVSLWGEIKGVPDSSNEYAIPFFEDINSHFIKLKDTILIVSGKEKLVSSRAGHQLMNNNPYAPTRFIQAKKNTLDIIQAMKEEDYEKFGHIVEQEALTLHALMMTSTPSYMLMHPHTIEIINRVRDFRNQTKYPIYFTLDAGPNIHLIYPQKWQSKIQPFIESDLIPLCENQRYIDDQVGKGTMLL